MIKNFEIGRSVIITGLLPFYSKYTDIYYKKGIIISINHFSSYPLTLLIKGTYISVPFDCVKII